MKLIIDLDEIALMSFKEKELQEISDILSILINKRVVKISV